MAKKKLKDYEVSVTAFASVLVVKAEDESKALKYATETLRFGDLQMDEAHVVRELKTKEEVESCRRNADAVAEED